MRIELKINFAFIFVLQAFFVGCKLLQVSLLARWTWPMIFLPCWAPTLLFSFFVFLLYVGWGVVLLLALYRQRKEDRHV